MSFSNTSVTVPLSGSLFAYPGLLPLADRTVLLLCFGLLLIIVECLRPGRVLPGAAGLLLLLLGVHDLMQLPLRSLALALFGVSVLLLAATANRRLWVVGGLLGTVTLAAALLLLVTPHPDSVQVSPPLAIALALLLGPLSTALIHVAIVARRAKRSTRPAARARVD